MAYSEKDGQVVLTMSREDYEALLIALGCYTGTMFQCAGRNEDVTEMIELLNRLNQGNPNYMPYSTQQSQERT